MLTELPRYPDAETGTVHKGLCVHYYIRHMLKSSMTDNKKASSKNESEARRKSDYSAASAQGAAGRM